MCDTFEYKNEVNEIEAGSRLFLAEIIKKIIRKQYTAADTHVQTTDFSKTCFALGSKGDLFARNACSVKAETRATRPLSIPLKKLKRMRNRQYHGYSIV